MALPENPSTPAMAHTGPIQACCVPGAALGATARSVPADEATPGGEQDHSAKRDAIPRERHEVVVTDVAQEPAHAQEGGHERGREPDAERAHVVRREQRAI